MLSKIDSILLFYAMMNQFKIYYATRMRSKRNKNKLYKSYLITIVKNFKWTKRL